MPPLSVIWPPPALAVTMRFPPTVLAARITLFASVNCAAFAPELLSVTAPPKSLPPCASVMAAAPADALVVPVTATAPEVWLIAVFVVPSVSAPPAVTL